MATRATPGTTSAKRRSGLLQSVILKVTVPKLDQLFNEILNLLPPSILSLKPKGGDIGCVWLNHVGLKEAFLLAGSDPVVFKMLHAMRDAARLSDRRVSH